MSVKRNLLEVKNVTKKFGSLIAVNNASLHISENEILGLIGPNGSGKSTMLHAICGRNLPTSGEITLFDQEITMKNPTARAAAGMAIKFQLARIYLDKTVRENILISLQAKESFFKQIRSATLKKHEEKIRELATEFQLIDYLHLPAKQLSHGQQQWLEISMAVAVNPVLLLLDEPTAGMSPAERKETAVLIKKASQHAGILIVEHDLDFIKELCDRISVMHYGEIVASGTPQEIESNPKVREVYLTRV